MESNGGGASPIRREIEALKEEKARIEQRISVLEAQLQKEASLAPQQQQNDGVCSGFCPSAISTVDANLAHGLSADSIYRYSRHLLLPSFGVQGKTLGFSVEFCLISRNYGWLWLITLRIYMINFLNWLLNAQLYLKKGWVIWKKLDSFVLYYRRTYLGLF